MFFANNFLQKHGNAKLITPLFLSFSDVSNDVLLNIFGIISNIRNLPVGRSGQGQVKMVSRSTDIFIYAC